jgi:hypothetical protein
MVFHSEQIFHPPNKRETQHNNTYSILCKILLWLSRGKGTLSSSMWSVKGLSIILKDIRFKEYLFKITEV